MKKAIIIPVEGETKVVDLEAPEGSLKVLQNAVGGWVQALDLTERLTMWCDEEGKVTGKPVNILATRMFWNAFGVNDDIIVGDIILTGGTDEEGATLGLTEEQVKIYEFLAN
jgi:hypothetical protein